MKLSRAAVLALVKENPGLTITELLKAAGDFGPGKRAELGGFLDTLLWWGLVERSVRGSPSDDRWWPA